MSMSHTQTKAMWTTASVWTLCLGLGCCLTSLPWGRKPPTRYRQTRPQPAGDGDTPNSTEYWFKQQLDHFDPTTDTEWQQRAWINSDYYKAGAPVLLMIGGEWEETGLSEDLSEPWEQIGKQLNALMFKLEHRFYGQSQPTGSTSGNLTLDDLQYLSSAQAGADLANFVAVISRKLPPGTRWIAFGCSYAGNLAAWLRYKYPHLVYAAVASSAPLQVKVAVPEYYKAVEKIIEKSYGNIKENNTMGKMCLEAYQQANKEVEELMKTPEGLNSTMELFFSENHELVELELNDTTTAAADSKLYSGVLLSLLTYVSSAVQNNNYDEDTGTWGIERFCDVMLNQSMGPLLHRYSHIYNILYSELSSDNETNLQWYYQMCSEFGYFTTLDNSSHGGYLNEKYFMDDCLGFGEKYTEEFVRARVFRTITMYGGLDLDATRVIYTGGTMDPWYPLGMNHTRNPLAPVYIVEGGSHCSDFSPTSAQDSPALLGVRANVTRTLMDWLGTPTPVQQPSS